MKKRSPSDAADRKPRPVRWVGDSKSDVSAFPLEVKNRMGGALWDAQIGLKSPAAKPLEGFGGAGVLEIVVDFDGNAFRTVYTVRFPEVVYVLHAFQKKSRHGIATPKSEMDVIRARLVRAKEDYDLWRRSGLSA